ncbi:MAG TPA: hypothetical protein VK838_03620 [Candidatus Limnocylindrales bacterium]|nr:hypothetical protein [Candidatus Limnocylindrales bacterium]
MTGPGSAAARSDLPGTPAVAPLTIALEATGVEQTVAVLPSTRRAVELPVYLRHETHWSNELPREFAAVPNKPAFSFDGEPLYPELVVVRLLERAGWGAALRKTWNGTAYWRGINDPVEPGPLALTIVEQISRQAGHLGQWDIVAWRGRELRLLTSRLAGGQRVTAFLSDWLDAALRLGIPLGCFAIVEHEVAKPRPVRRR